MGSGGSKLLCPVCWVFRKGGEPRLPFGAKPQEPVFGAAASFAVVRYRRRIINGTAGSFTPNGPGAQVSWPRAHFATFRFDTDTQCAISCVNEAHRGWTRVKSWPEESRHTREPYRSGVSLRRRRIQQCEHFRIPGTEGILGSSASGGLLTDAFAFTPKANYTFTAAFIDVWAMTGQDASVSAALYDTNPAATTVPGKLIAQLGTVNAPSFASLPALPFASNNVKFIQTSGPPATLTAGQQYWLVISAGDAKAFVFVALGGATTQVPIAQYKTQYGWTASGSNSTQMEIDGTPSAPAANYFYDTGAHLAKVDYGSAGAVLYSYDKAGNLISRQVQGASAAAPTGPVITAVANAQSGATTIAPNTWTAIYGANLAPSGDSRTWASSDFGSNQLPSQLDGVSVTVNGKSAFVYYISPTQVNILTPPDPMQGAVQVQLTNGAATSAAFAVQAQTIAPAFFVYAGNNVLAVHANGSLIGPASLYPGTTTPAAPGETILLFANGFGPTSSALTNGGLGQSGSLPTLPVVTIGGQAATVLFAGLISPGLYQFNVVVPSAATSGTNSMIANYSGQSTQAGVTLTVQR